MHVKCPTCGGANNVKSVGGKLDFDPPVLTTPTVIKFRGRMIFVEGDKDDPRTQTLAETFENWITGMMSDKLHMSQSTAAEFDKLMGE